MMFGAQAAQKGESKPLIPKVLKTTWETKKIRIKTRLAPSPITRPLLAIKVAKGNPRKARTREA